MTLTPDIIKDAIVLPQAFISALNGDSERAFRETLTMQFNRFEALDQMIEVLQKISQSSFTIEEDS